jgi:hypothetical protein
MAGGGIGEAMLISAVTGAGTSAVMGGDPLKGALLGAATGGIGHGVAGATAGGGAGAAGATGTAAATDAATNLATQTAADAGTNLAAGIDPGLMATGQVGVTPSPMELAEFQRSAASFQPPTGGPNAFNFGPDGLVPPGAGEIPATFDSNKMLPVSQQRPAYGSMTGTTATGPQTALQQFYAKNPIAMPAGLGALGSVIGAGPESNMPGEEKYDGPLSRFRYDPDKYRRGVRSGGLMDTEPARRMAGGGHLGSYSDGGQLLKGPGDGMSDDIPASIGEDQPALLADGEFVVPADVVSGIGNGSTDAGAKQLYAMMDAVRKARTGREEQAPEIDAQRMMPA